MMGTTINKGLEGFSDHFGKIRDPRMDRRKLYPLQEMLLLALCATISGANCWTEIELFGKQRLEILRKIYPFQNGIPTDDTIRRLFRVLDPQVFRECFINWVESLQKSTAKLIAIDGKTMCGSQDRVHGNGPLHIVSAWSSDLRLVLGQVKTAEKSNEIKAIPELLNLLSIESAVVTIDAMGCQKHIAKKIIEKKADYVLAVKDNQKLLHQEIAKFFDYHKQKDFIGCGYDFSMLKTTDGDHGRIEVRKCVAIDQTEWMAELSKWQGLKSIVMIESERSIKGKTSNESRYYISSLPANAAVIANAVRSHWGVENNLHWQLDVTFDEDNIRIRKGHAPANMNIIRHASLNMLKTAQTKHNDAQTVKSRCLSVQALRKAAGWNVDWLLQIIMPTAA